MLLNWCLDAEVDGSQDGDEVIEESELGLPGWWKLNDSQKETKGNLCDQIAEGNP